MTSEAFLQQAKSWLNPPAPGLNKGKAIGFLMGLLLGPLGAGLYLRSLFDFGCSVAVAVVLSWTLGTPPDITGAIVGAAWAVGRISWDTHQARNGPGGGEAAAAGPVPPAPQAPHAGMTVATA